MRSEKCLTKLLDVMYAISKSEDRMILRQDFRSMANIYADKIEKELFDHEVIYTSNPRPLISNSDSKLLRHIEEIECEIKDLQGRKHDRHLANSSMAFAILCGTAGVILSGISYYRDLKSEGEISRLEHRVVTLEKSVANLKSPVLLDSIYLPAQLDDSLTQAVNLRFKIVDPKSLGTVRADQSPIPSDDTQGYENRR